MGIGDRLRERIHQKPEGHFAMKRDMKDLYDKNITKRHRSTPTFDALWNNAKELAKTNGESLEYLMPWAIIYAGERNKELVEASDDNRVANFAKTTPGFEKTTYVNDAFEEDEEFFEKFPSAAAGITDEKLEEEPSDASITMMLGPPPMQTGGGRYALSSLALAAVTVAMAVLGSTM